MNHASIDHAVFSNGNRSDLCTKGFKAFDMRKLKTFIPNISVYKFFRIRERYILTRSNRLRARYGVMALAFGVLVSSLLLQDVEKDNQRYDSMASIEPLAGETAAENASDNDFRYASVLPENLIDLVRRTEQPDVTEDGPENRDFVIKSGQTIAGILQNAGVSGGQAYKIVEALGEYLDVRKIRAGQSFQARFEPADTGDEEGELVLAEMVMDIDPLKSVSISKSGEDFSAELKEKDVVSKTYAGAAEIQTSLYGSAARSGIPSQAIAKMIRMYSWSVDFQRDIRRDDRIELLYEVLETEDGEPVKYGDIQYANLSVGGIDMPLYRFEDKDGDVGYYDRNGRSIKKTLMKTPVDGARMSSGYGMRKHPILGYGKMHKGVDFAAPVGTPVYAAGDGVLERVGRNGGYGNYIRLRHNSTLKTAYAHLHKFAPGISAGKRVKQGQVIAYIGSTGRSTGPHLHYEVLMNGKQVNPNRVDLPVGESLEGEDLKAFKQIVKKINKEYKDRMNGMKYASSDKGEDKKKAG